MEQNPFDLVNSPLPEKEKPIQIKDIELTEEQKLILLKLWEQSDIPPAMSTLVKAAWPNATKEMLDGRSLYAKAVKTLLTKNDISVPTTSAPVSKAIELTETQKEYLLNNCKTMKPLELARELFANQNLSAGSSESRAVIAFLRELDPAILYGDDIPDVDYSPPKRVIHVVARIKKYVNATRNWQESKLTPSQKKECESLIHYLHDFRFKRQIDSYEKTEDKITFESEFIKYTYNKPDLEQEEISQYVALCSFVVQEFNIKQHIEMLQRNIEKEYEEHDGKISGNLIEALESARADLGNCTLRQGKLYESLTEKRSEKISKELKDKESLLNLFNTWKNHDSRQQLLKIRQKDKENLRKQIQEIEDMSELKIRVLGISVDEIIDG